MKKILAVFLFLVLQPHQAFSTVTSYPSFGDQHWKAPVASVSALPSSGNLTNDVRTTMDTFASYIWNGSSWSGLSGGVIGPGSSTNNAIARWNGTGGNQLNDSLAFVDNSGNITGTNLSGTNSGDVTLGTANGLSLSSQVLSLGLSGASTTGALSSTDWNTFNTASSLVTGQPADTFAGFDASGNLVSVSGWAYQGSGLNQNGLNSYINFSNAPDSGSSTYYPLNQMSAGLNLTADTTNNNPRLFSPNLNIMTNGFNTNDIGVIDSYNPVSGSGNISNLSGFNSFFDLQGSGTISSLQVNQVGYHAHSGQGVGDSSGYTYRSQIDSGSGITGYDNQFSSNLDLSGTVGGGVIGVNIGGYIRSSGTSPHWTGFNFSPTLDGSITSDFQVLSSFPQFNSGSSVANYYGVLLGGSGTGTISHYKGVQISPGSITTPDATGMNIDLSSVTSANQKIGLSINDGGVNIGSNYDTSVLPASPGEFQQTLIGGTFHVASGHPMTSSFGFGNNIGPSIFFEDSMGPDGIGLGYSVNGLVNQTAGLSGKTLDTLNYMFAGSGIPSASTGGTVTNANLFRAYGFLNEGGTLNVTNLTAFDSDAGLCTGTSIAHCWGLQIKDSLADNWMAKDLVIGGSTGTPLNPGVGIDVQTGTVNLNGNNLNMNAGGGTGGSDLNMDNGAIVNAQAYQFSSGSGMGEAGGNLVVAAQTTGEPVLIIPGSGANVGINTLSTPTATLDVNGTLGVRALTTPGVIANDSSGNVTTVTGATDGQVLTADSTQTQGVKWANPGASSGAPENLAINPALAFFQERTTTVMPVATTSYVADGFYAQNSMTGAGVLTATQVSPTLNQSFNGLSVAVTIAGTGGNYQLAQTLENVMSQRLYNQTISMSIWVKALGNITQVGFGSYYQTGQTKVLSGSSAGVIGSENIASVNSSTFTQITLTGIPVGTSLTRSGVLGWALRPVTASSGTIHDIGNGFVVEQVMITPTPSVPVAFVSPSYDDQLNRCDFLYETDYDLGTLPGTASTNDGATIWTSRGADQQDFSMFFYKRRKMKIPTVTIYSPITGLTGMAYDIDGGTDIPVSVSVAGQTSVFIQPTANTVSGHRYYYHVSVDSRI